MSTPRVLADAFVGALDVDRRSTRCLHPRFRAARAQCPICRTNIRRADRHYRRAMRGARSFKRLVEAQARERNISPRQVRASFVPFSVALNGPWNDD